MLELFAFPNLGLTTMAGAPFFLKGVNWFGFETETYSPHGLWSASMDYLLDFMQKERVNAVRVPFSTEFVENMDTFDPTAIDYSKNPDLRGKKAGEVMDVLVKKCRKRGILVMPDMHRMEGKGGITPLWYENPRYPEARVLRAWQKLVRRYRNEPTVFAVDLKNEPHGEATWGGAARTDWAAAAERMGNALHEINPRLLIMVEGVSRCSRPPYRTTWWGGCLDGVRDRPLRLRVKNKLVYSPHVYGPDVFPLPLFGAGTGFPDNMPAVWDAEWGFVQKEKRGAVIVGEWGGQNRPGTPDRVWQNALLRYFEKNGFMCKSFYWSLNPNSGDTQGLLEDDWRTPVPYRVAMLARACPQPSSVLALAGGDGTPQAIPMPRPIVMPSPEPSPVPSSEPSSWSSLLPTLPWMHRGWEHFGAP